MYAFPHPAFTQLKSYLTDRTFQVRYQEEYTTLQHPIRSTTGQYPLTHTLFNIHRRHARNPAHADSDLC